MKVDSTVLIELDNREAAALKRILGIVTVKQLMSGYELEEFEAQVDASLAGRLHGLIPTPDSDDID